VFAHRILWYLQSYCLSNEAFASQESQSRIHMLIDEVSARGVVPARTIETLAVENKGNDEASDMTAAMAASRSHETESLLPVKQYNTFLTKLPPLDLECGAGAADPFQLETAFLNALATVSSNLRSVPITRRNDMVRVTVVWCVEKWKLMFLRLCSSARGWGISRTSSCRAIPSICP
jgi:hypothetical protein